jgi:hypothetical protein
MAESLKAVVHFLAVPAGGTVSQAHGLTIGDAVAVTPDVLTPSTNGNFFTPITANSTTVTVTNTDVAAHDLDVLCEYWHSVERAFGGTPTVDLAPRPFVVGSGGAGGVGPAGPAGAAGAAGPAGPAGPMYPTYTTTLSVEDAQFLAATFPQYTKVNGAEFPVAELAYDDAANESAFWSFPALLYGSGNLTVTLEWYATSAVAGDCVWGAAIACITPTTDTQDVETKTLAAENTATTTHPGTTAKRLLQTIITVTNLDAITAGDMVWLRLRRLSAGNTMAGDANLVKATVAWSTT